MAYDKRLSKTQRRQITKARRSIRLVEETGDKYLASKHLNSVKRGSYPQAMNTLKNHVK